MKKLKIMISLMLFLSIAYSQDSFTKLSNSFTYDTKSPEVNLTSPNGGESFGSNQDIPVTWTATDDNFNDLPISIALSHSIPEDYTTIPSDYENDGTESIKFTDVTDTDNAKVKIIARDSFGNETSDVSDDFFSIYESVDNSINLNFVSVSENPDLNDNKFSPGERLQFTFNIDNSSDKKVFLVDVIITSSDCNIEVDFLNPFIRFDEYNGIEIGENNNRDIEDLATLHICNWPSNVSTIKINFELYFEKGISETFTKNISVERDLYIPEENSIYIIKNRIKNEELTSESIISTSYYPFMRIDQCPGSDGLKAASSILGLFTGIIWDHLGTLLYDAAKSTAIDYITGLPYKEQEKYNYMWVVAGTENDNLVIPEKNFFFTNEPNNNWKVPPLDMPVKVIAKVKKLSEYIETENEHDSWLIEPLTYVPDTNFVDNYTYLNKYKKELIDTPVWQIGVVHGVWKDNSGNSFFSVVTELDDPVNLPIIGSITNAIYNRHIIRHICQINDESQLPELKSTVLVRGTLKKDFLDLPKSFSGGMKYYIMAESVDIISGQFCNNFHEREWFDVSSIGNLSLDLFRSNSNLGKVTLSASTKNDNIPHLHLYDKAGNHTGYVYNDNEEVMGIEMNIPSSFYSGIKNDNQFILIDSTKTTGFCYKITNTDNVEDNNFTLTLNVPSQTDTFPTTVVLIEDVATDTTEYEDFISVIFDDSLGIIMDSTYSTVIIDPVIWKSSWSGDNSYVANFYIGDLSNNLGVEEIVLDSIKINDKYYIDTENCTILSDHLDFEGSVLEIGFPIGTLISDFNNYGKQLISIDFITMDCTAFHQGILVEILEFTDLSSSADSKSPEIFHLKQNYPNPFNPTTIISFEIPKESYVDITIYNLAGEKIKTLINHKMKTGYHSITWNATDMPTGIYLYRINAGNFLDIKKCILMK